MAASVLFRCSMIPISGAIAAQPPSNPLLDQANVLTIRLRDAHLDGTESSGAFDYESLLALADRLDRDPRPGTSAKAAECLVWCLGLIPGEPGYVRAYLRLANMYRLGRGVPRDKEYADELDAALQQRFDARRPRGLQPADTRLVAGLLESGRIYPKDFLAAAAWRFQAKDRARALKLCHAVAGSDPGRRSEVIQTLLEAKEISEARRLLTGLRPSKTVSPLNLAALLAQAGQEQEAVRLLIEASEGGDVTASRQLAWAYRNGKGFGIQVKDGVLYLHHLRLAADRGDPDALLELGQVYWRGEWIPTDPRQAVDCFSKAGTYGKAYLAEALFLGRGADLDMVRALSLFRDAYEEHPVPRPDHPPIADRLAQIYREGLGVPKDLAMAARFCSRAWRRDSTPVSLEELLNFDELLRSEAPVESWIELGAVLKATGRFGTAAKVFQKALSLGSAQAEAELGDLHAHDRREGDEFRDGFRPDWELGKRLLASARDRGIKTLWQPLGFRFKRMDWEVSPDEPELEGEPDTGPSFDWMVKSRKFTTGEGVPVDPIRALYYKLCALRDAPGC